MSEEKKKCIQTGINNVCMVVLGVYFTFHGLNASIYHFQWPEAIELYFSFAFGVTAIIRLLLCGLYKDRNLWKAVFFALLCGISYVTSGYDFLLTLAGMSLMVLGFDASKLWKAAFWIQLITLIVTVVGVQTGIIEDLIYLPNGVIRHSFGINYPTDFAAHLVLLILLLWVVYKKVSNLEIFGLALLADILVWKYCAAKCGAILLTTFLLLVLYEMLYSCLNQRKGMQWVEQMVYVVKLIGMPFVSVLCIVVTWVYDGTGILETINAMLTRRISAGQTVLLDKGLSLFGQEVQMMGNGGGVGTQSAYYFVDSSYVLLGIRYGVLLLIAVNLLYMYAVYRGRKENSRRMVIAMVIIAMQAMVEHHLMESWFNVFLLTALMNNITNDSETENLPKKEWKKHLLIWCGLLLLLIAACMLLPSVYSTARTLVNLYDIPGKENHMGYILFILCILFLAALCVGLAVYAIRRILEHKKGYIKFFVASFVLVGLLVALYVMGKRMALKSNDAYDEALLSEKDILMTLTEQFDGKIYVTDTPVLYRHYFGKVSLTMFTPELLDWQEDVIFVVPNEKENRILLHDGYQYSQISNMHGIYTNSESAKEILVENGFEISDFCNARRYYTAKEIKEYNPDIILDTDGEIIVRPWLPLTKGPNGLFFQGTMNVCVDMSLYDWDSAPDGIAAIISMDSSNNQNWLAYEVTAADIGEDGRFILNVDLSIYNNIDKLQFKIEPLEKTQIKIHEISYQKISNEY